MNIYILVSQSHTYMHIPARGNHFCNAVEKANINSLQLLKHLLRHTKKEMHKLRTEMPITTHCLYSLVSLLKKSNAQLQGGVNYRTYSTCIVQGEETRER